MNGRIEEYNYWNDHRTIAGMVPNVEIRDGKIVFEDEDGTEHLLNTKFEVCGTCRGHGKHVNPSIDASGFQPEDQDDVEMYMSGAYDVTCSKCDGLRVVPVLDEQTNDPALIKEYQEYRQSLWDDARTSAAERAMGA